MKIRTAESVSPKHPDKICDQISDSILDALLAADPKSRVAVEAAGGHGLVVVIGEVTSSAKVNYDQIIRNHVGEEITVTINMVEQSPEIAAGVDTGGAGDQGIMVGYATSETKALIPLEVELSRSLNRFIYGEHSFDGKTQITLEDDVITAVVSSFQNVPQAELKKLVDEWLGDKQVHDKVAIHANPAGDWHQGGFEADSGLTGRKLIVDNYGPRIPIGGGAFSGKDPSKVDRSAAYMARKVAVDYLNKKGAEEVWCYLGYAIGVAEPVHATVILDGKEEKISGYDLTPRGIIEYLDLLKPQYEQTAQYGHFGNNFKWDS